ncbi:ribonuclease Z [Candidatus Woesearchaeota archaeon]|nr:ribonuclease Z [Candidatus Woesearchaeota archaeon]
MIDIQFLGTACMAPTKNRNHSATLLKFKGMHILFDCGENTQRQMKIAGIKPGKTTHLLITHWHGDHVFGIPGLLSTMGAESPDQHLQIYGPKGTKKYMEHLLKSFSGHDIANFTITEVNQGIIFENEDFFIEAQPMKHSIPCVGYAFQEKDRLRINVAKAKKLNLTGPVLGKLQKGKNVTVDGKKILANDLTYSVEGKRIGYVVDTLLCTGATKIAQDCDLLIAEGTHLDEIKEKTERAKHLTVKQAALLASEHNVKKLVVTHLSQRYKSTDRIVEEARTYFDNYIVAEDFMRFKL